MKALKFYLSLMLLFVLTANAQEGQFISATDWDNLVAKAKKEKKMIFVDSYFVGCHPCKQMDDEVFPLPQVMKLMQDNFISVKIDFLKEDLGKQLQVKYAVTGFPTFLLLNSNAELVSKFSGYQEADKFQTLLKEAIAKSKKGETLKGFSASMAVEYPDFYVAAFKERKAYTAQDLVNYLKGNNITEERYAVPFLFNRSVSPELSEYLLKNYYPLEKMYGKDMVWSKRIAAMAAKLKTSVPERDDVKFAAFLAEVKPLFSKEDWPYAKLDIAEEYYYKQLKDHKTFFKYAAENYNDDDNKVRYMAFYLSLPTVDEEEKKLYAEWMKKVVKESSSYELLGTATRIMLDQKQKEKAKQYAGWGIKKAGLVNKSDKYFQASLN
ncbi:thioredoxin family protein [Pedobacter frigoris]|uniref:thioredoxin family protein n=1 Tax=Pedobacter frigoris TaxID=2571272 RepID=UPI0029305C13|nr:thioredoxin fold domain-containing protein [Pedobacter frigoris]